ncbi:hypothetical protein COOONC_23526 [Cooperia oncophora]
MEIHWLTNDYVSLVADILQLILFAALYIFARGLSNDRLDAHHKAHARGDIAILFGCCVILFVKLILQSVEVEFQRKDGFTTTNDAIIATICYAAIQASQWLQYFSMRRILALSDRDCRATKRFLPLVAAGGLLMAWIHFGITFFDTSLIKYQLTDEEFEFSQTTLICMIFTQTIFPATICLRSPSVVATWNFSSGEFQYLNMGFFQLGTPRLSISHSHHHDEHVPEVNKRSQNGPNIATMMHAANVMYRKRMESDHEVCIVVPLLSKRLFFVLASIHNC